MASERAFSRALDMSLGGGSRRWGRENERGGLREKGERGGLRKKGERGGLRKKVERKES